MLLLYFRGLLELLSTEFIVFLYILSSYYVISPPQIVFEYNVHRDWYRLFNFANNDVIVKLEQCGTGIGTLEQYFAFDNLLLQIPKLIEPWRRYD